MRMMAIAAALVALALVKVHTIQDGYGRTVTRLAIASPLSMPFDSAAAECMREWREPLQACARAFALRDRFKLIDLPACSFCSDAALALAFSGMSPEAAAGRRRDIRDAGLT